MLDLYNQSKTIFKCGSMRKPHIIKVKQFLNVDLCANPLSKDSSFMGLYGLIHGLVILHFVGEQWDTIITRFGVDF